MQGLSYVEQKQLVYKLLKDLHQIIPIIPVGARVHFRNSLVELKKQLEQLTETEWKDNAYPDDLHIRMYD